MKPEHIAQFTDEVLTVAAERYALDKASLNRLDGFENMVLEAKREGEAYILRLSHSSHRSVDQVHAELHWIDYLAGAGVSVCRPLRSKAGTLIEVIDGDDADLCAVVFEKAKGRQVRRNDQTPRMTYNRGKLMGQMHALTRKYLPHSERVKRKPWYAENDFVIFDQYIGPEDAVVVERFRELIDTLRSFPVDRDNFGLIHMDAHTDNIFMDGDNPILFDFDDCAYDFFISDIAIALFYAVLMLPSKWDRSTFAKDFLTTYLEGYRTENSLDRRWLEVIPMILKRREILLYVAIHRGYDINNLDEWATRYLDGRRKRIENQVPVLDLDWTEFKLSD